MQPQATISGTEALMAKINAAALLSQESLMTERVKTNEAKLQEFKRNAAPVAKKT